jgi:hypothetical protein
MTLQEALKVLLSMRLSPTERLAVTNISQRISPATPSK